MAPSFTITKFALSKCLNYSVKLNLKDVDCKRALMYCQSRTKRPFFRLSISDRKISHLSISFTTEQQMYLVSDAISMNRSFISYLNREWSHTLR